MNRFALVAVLLVACGGAPAKAIAPPPPPRPTNVAPASPPGARLAAAAKVGRALDVPAQFIEGRPSLDGMMPSPAFGLDERWVLGAEPSVCRSAFYVTDLPDLHSTDPAWNELVSSLAGDDRFRHAELARDGMRFALRRERFCIYHECKPPLSPPSITLDVCDDQVTVDDPRDVVVAMLAHIPTLTGHASLLDVAGVQPVSVLYRRNGDGRDEVQITVSAGAGAQDALRKLLAEKRFADPSPNLPWAMNSTDSLRSYLFYPSSASPLVSFSGRSRD